MTLGPSKTAVLAALREALTKERAECVRHAKDAAEAASHEENRAEGDKDMRSTEASYVARGQAERVHAIDHTVAVLSGVSTRTFQDGERIAVGALVDVECDGRTSTYFILAAGGGMTVDLEGVRVVTLATTSPLGRALLGLEVSDEAELPSREGARTHTVLRVR